MRLRAAATLGVALFLQSHFVDANETDADTTARLYFERACADKMERVGVYAPANHSFSDITTGATRNAYSWDKIRFERLCALPELYVYHCHTTNDVLTRFPSGSEGGAPGDFGTAAEMEFTCAEAAVLTGHPPANLAHGLVTPQGEVIKYGFTTPILAAIDEQGRLFGRALEEDGPRNELKTAEAAAQRFFSALNAAYFDSFMRFVMKACPNGDIEHCEDLTVERFASTLSPEEGRFIRVQANSASGPVSGPLSGREPEPVTQDKPVRLPAGSSARDTASGGIVELTEQMLGAFVAEGKAIVSICAEDAEGLLPCKELKVRVAQLAAVCPRVKAAILDQDKHPQARYLYPLARNWSLLLFKTNPQSGVNEQFDLTTMGEPTPQLIGMTLCGAPPFSIPSFAR